MKKFTKDMLAPGKHVIELRNGRRYLVLQCKEKLFLTNFKLCFNNLSCFDEEMKYTNVVGLRVELEDVMKVFVMTSPVPMGQYLFDDEYLTEIWHREELFITPDEKTILRNIKNEYEYIVRNKNEVLVMYPVKPRKNADCWGSYYHCMSMYMFNHLFQMVQWTDDEPWKIDDLLKLDVKEDK